MSIWSIVIGVLATVITVSFSAKSGSDMYGNKVHKYKKQSCVKNSKQLLVKWKGVRKMTIIFTTFMVSIGIPGRDSVMCS